MTDERNMYQQPSHMKPTESQCEQHKDYHVMVTLEDGSTVDGIIIDVRNDKITMLISEDVMVDEKVEAKSSSSNDRQFGYGRRRARRFRRSVLPIAGLTALALFPYFTPYPYYQYPYYPYYY
ncbi:hypothetical protein [Halobacillus sp. B29]|uniref:hypothetical protein n=1 Tax=Halobacillus sp. B29 TaxID=3457432 RepID=UPI003FCDF097